MIWLSALAAAYGVHLLYTALAYRWGGLGLSPRPQRSRRNEARDRLHRWMLQAGAGEVEPQEFLGACALLAIGGCAAGFAIFGGILPALGLGAFGATLPPASYRVRRQHRLSAAHDAWPHMIDEIRVLTNSAGRSIPQALFEVGLRGPEPLRPAFEAAHREWILSTNFERTTTLLKSLLADTTADAACETLLVAHEVGGSDLDRRLAELAEDRRQEYLGRMDARSKQSGVRFARNFVLLVPLGMASAGLTLGDGRAAYQKPFGQVLVAFGLGLVGICWMWSARMLRLPETGRVFDR